MPGELQFLKGQLFESISVPTTDLSGRTIIVTGANSGLGLDAAKHLYRLNCGKVILACRNLEKGEAAKKDIIGSGQNGKSKPAVEVWQLDMGSYASVKAFAERAAHLERLDAAILNAGIDMKKFSLVEGLEETLTVNVTATFLLALLLLPAMRTSATRFPDAGAPHLEIVGSAVHFFANTKALTGHANGSILTDLSNAETAVMAERYYLSKLLVILCVIQMAQEISHSAQVSKESKPLVIVNNTAPGFCKTGLFRHDQGFAVHLGAKLIGRDSEKGARNLVHGILAGEESHGQYMSEARVKPYSDFVKSVEGKEIGKKVWQEVLQIAEGVAPGVKETL